MVIGMVLLELSSTAKCCIRAGGEIERCRERGRSLEGATLLVKQVVLMRGCPNLKEVKEGLCPNLNEMPGYAI
jgi:hypothetical protein